MDSFVVTGHGRSGTSWLARELNKSKQWTVCHEGRTIGLMRSIPTWTLPPFHGTVDSRLRLVAASMWARRRFDKLAVILRHPVDIVASAYGRSKPKLEAITRRIIADLDKDLAALNELALLRGVHVIKFTDMIKGGEEFSRLAHFLGISDLPGVDTNPANGPTKTRLPGDILVQVAEKGAAFARRWNLESQY